MTSRHEDARAERAILSSAEAYRLVEEAREQRDRAERAEAENARLTAERDAVANELEGTRSALYWQAKTESAERERDAALMRLASSRYAAAEWRRQRDEAQQALEHALEES